MEIIDYVYSKLFETKALATRNPKFEDYYIIYRSEFVYLNDPHYKNFVRFLEDNNKIAVVFASAEDTYHMIPDSPLVLRYKGKDIDQKNKIIQDLRNEFEAKLNAYEGTYKVERPTPQTDNILELIVDAIDVDFIDLG
jgi:hypothetical protein